MTLVPSTSLAQARRDVREKARAFKAAELALEETRCCSTLVHPKPQPECSRCNAWWAADAAAKRAELAFDSACRRLQAVESQQRPKQTVGGVPE